MVLWRERDGKVDVDSARRSPSPKVSSGEASLLFEIPPPGASFVRVDPERVGLADKMASGVVGAAAAAGSTGDCDAASNTINYHRKPGDARKTITWR